MAPPDGTMFGLLADPVCKQILRHLVQAGRPLTQRVLTAELGLNSSTISRRMSTLESAGLVLRGSPHAPYELTFPAQVHQLLLADADLTFRLADQQAQRAAVELRELQDIAPVAEPDPDRVRRPS